MNTWTHAAHSHTNAIQILVLIRSWTTYMFNVQRSIIFTIIFHIPFQTIKWYWCWNGLLSQVCSICFCMEWNQFLFTSHSIPFNSFGFVKHRLYFILATTKNEQRPSTSYSYLIFGVWVQKRKRATKANSLISYLVLCGLLLLLLRLLVTFLI